MDESGDLGFNFNRSKTSKYFVITFLLTEDKKLVEKLVKKTFSKMSKKEIQSHDGVLHAYKETPKTKAFILREFQHKKLGTILTIYLNKHKVYTKLHNEKHVLYNYVTNILLDRIFTKKFLPTSDTIHLIASRRETNKFLNHNFSNYISSQTKNSHKLNIQISVSSPKQEKGLQIVDVLCWSIFRKHEHGDLYYYNFINSLILEENPLFP